MGYTFIAGFLIFLILIRAALTFSLRGPYERIISRPALRITWSAALLLTLGVLLLPSYSLVENFSSPFSEPFQSFYGFILYMLPVLALIMASLLLSFVLGGVQAQPTAPDGWRAATSLILSSVLLASSFYNLYWQFVWDQTTDSFYVLLLPVPVIAAFIAGLFLTRPLQSSRKWYGFGYSLLLVAALVTTFSIALRVDYYRLTEARAAQVSQAIERYYARAGHYPARLAELVPGTRLSLPKPVIMTGQDWCYQSGDHYYRLGYVSRDHWSIPYLYIHQYRQAGTIPDIPALCNEETRALISRTQFLRVVGE
jgi:hypothetical protein